MCLRGRLRSVALNFCRSYSVLRPGYREKRRIVSAVEHEKHFELKWSDGSVSRCLYLWLRDNAPQRHTYEISDVCNARRMLLRDLRLDLRPTHTSAESDTLNVQWSDGAQCSYSSTWLGQHVLFDADLRKERRRVYMQREAVLWNRETFEKENYLKHWSWTALHEDDQVLHDFLTQFQQAGVVFVDSFPAQENELCAFVRRVAGFEFRTHYGSYFDVRSEANPTNVAYTSDALGFHTDLPYLQYPPQIQLLHCIAQSPSGGLSRYVDGFEVARQLRRDHPEVYKILCRAPLEYIDDGRDDIQFDLTNRWPVFNTDPLSGQLSHIQFSNQQRGWFYDCDDEERLFEIYRAMIRFNEYMESERNFIEFTMQPGSIGMFSNTRVLHARTPFAPPRLLQGTYIRAAARPDSLRLWLQFSHTPEQVAAAVALLKPQERRLLKNKSKKLPSSFDTALKCIASGGRLRQVDLSDALRFTITHSHIQLSTPPVGLPAALIRTNLVQRYLAVVDLLSPQQSDAFLKYQSYFHDLTQCATLDEALGIVGHTSSRGPESLVATLCQQAGLDYDDFMQTYRRNKQSNWSIDALRLVALSMLLSRQLDIDYRFVHACLDVVPSARYDHTALQRLRLGNSVLSVRRSLATLCECFASQSFRHTMLLHDLSRLRSAVGMKNRHLVPFWLTNVTHEQVQANLHTYHHYGIAAPRFLAAPHLLSVHPYLTEKRLAYRAKEEWFQKHVKEFWFVPAWYESLKASEKHKNDRFFKSVPVAETEDAAPATEEEEDDEQVLPSSAPDVQVSLEVVSALEVDEEIAIVRSNALQSRKERVRGVTHRRLASKYRTMQLMSAACVANLHKRIAWSSLSEKAHQQGRRRHLPRRLQQQPHPPCRNNNNNVNHGESRIKDPEAVANLLYTAGLHDDDILSCLHILLYDPTLVACAIEESNGLSITTEEPKIHAENEKKKTKYVELIFDRVLQLAKEQALASMTRVLEESAEDEEITEDAEVAVEEVFPMVEHELNEMPRRLATSH